MKKILTLTIEYPGMTQEEFDNLAWKLEQAVKFAAVSEITKHQRAAPQGVDRQSVPFFHSSNLTVTSAVEKTELSPLAKEAQDLDALVLACLDDGNNFVQIVKEVRIAFGYGLREAVDVTSSACTRLGSEHPKALAAYQSYRGASRQW